jgi:hypothetical protein
MALMTYKDSVVYVCVAYVCSYIAVLLSPVTISSVVAHGYPCQEHLAFYVNDLMTQQLTTVHLETVRKIDDAVQRCDVFIY